MKLLTNYDNDTIIISFSTGKNTNKIFYEGKIKNINNEILKNLRKELKKFYKKDSTIFEKIEEVKNVKKNFIMKNKFLRLSKNKKNLVKNLYLRKNWFFKTEGEFNEISEEDFKKLNATWDYTSPSGSTYYINRKDDLLVRISDHWGQVRSCYWTIKDTNGKKDEGENTYKIGVIKISDFKVRNEELLDQFNRMKGVVESYKNDELIDKDLSKIVFKFANLNKINLSERSLKGLDLSGADLSEANLKGANLSGVDLSGADLSGADLSGAILSGANLIGTDLNGTIFKNTSFKNCKLIGANLNNAVFKNTSFKNCKLIGANLNGMDLSGVDLSGADLRNAWLNNTNLKDANLSGADLRGADLRDVDLSNADLIGADLRDAYLGGANLINIKL